MWPTAGPGAGKAYWVASASGAKKVYGSFPARLVHTFGMRFAIDLVYLDRCRKVKKVRSNVAPMRLSGCLSAHSVLELAAGTVRRTGTEPGDLLEFTSAD